MKKLLIVMSALFAIEASAADLKINAEMSVETARASCELMSERAKKDGVQVLVIGFEGLASYSAALAAGAYRLNNALRRGLKSDNVAIPYGYTGYMTAGFLIPLIRKHGKNVEVLIFPHSAIGAGGVPPAEICARAWMNAGGDAALQKTRRLVIAGHSYGGHAAIQMANDLKVMGVKVDAVFTMDPRARGGQIRWSKASNVRVWNNFYQLYGGLSGYPVPGAKNINMTGKTSHVSIPYSQNIQSAFSKYMAEAAH